MFPTDAHFDRALARLEHYTGSVWVFVAATAVVFAVFQGVLIALESLMLLPKWLTARDWMVPLLISTFIISIWNSRKSAVKGLRAELLALGIPVCLACGYDLRGTVSQRCSECGRELDARVREILVASREPESTPMQT